MQNNSHKVEHATTDSIMGVLERASWRVLESKFYILGFMY